MNSDIVLEYTNAQTAVRDIRNQFNSAYLLTFNSNPSYGLCSCIHYELNLLWVEVKSMPVLNISHSKVYNVSKILLKSASSDHVTKGIFIVN
jgi:hypothetical protein